MSEEELRRFLIYLLKNNKVYYLEMSGSYQEYCDKKELDAQLEVLKNDTEILKGYNDNNPKSYLNNFGRMNSSEVEANDGRYRSIL